MRFITISFYFKDMDQKVAAHGQFDLENFQASD